MKLQKKYLEPILIAINYPINKFALCRRRDAVRDVLITEYKKYSAERKAIQEKFCIKDKDQKPVLNEFKNYTFTEKNEEKATKELEILVAEEIEIVPNIEPRVTIGEVKNIVEQSTVAFEAGATTTLGELFDSMESNTIKKAKRGK